MVFLGFFGWVFIANPATKAHTSEISLVGRLVFNTWRMMRGELALYSYTLESVAFKVAFWGGTVGWAGGGVCLDITHVLWAVLWIRIRDEHPGSCFRELGTIIWVKILKFFDAVPGSGLEKIRIRDGKNLDPG